MVPYSNLIPLRPRLVQQLLGGLQCPDFFKHLVPELRPHSLVQDLTAHRFQKHLDSCVWELFRRLPKSLDLIAEHNLDMGPMASVRAATKTFKKLAGTNAVKGGFLGTCFTGVGFGSKRAIARWASADATPNPGAELLPFVLLTT